jgi:GH24 family phage-related lysozyme (muramidase)
MDRKPIFDAIRKLLKRGLAQGEVDALDGAIDDAAGGPSANIRTIGPAGAALIRNWEACARRRSDGLIEAYPDPGSTDGRPWTIGWGSTGPEIGPETVWTQEQCDARLDHDLARYADEVAAAIGAAPTTSNQFDALVSFHYNTGAIRRATLTRKHCAGWCAAGRRKRRCTGVRETRSGHRKLRQLRQLAFNNPCSPSRSGSAGRWSR